MVETDSLTGVDRSLSFGCRPQVALARLPALGGRAGSDLGVGECWHQGTLLAPEAMFSGFVEL